jgi:hypothetical protein
MNPKGVRLGGRQKGTPNKVTTNLREKISAFLDRKWDVIESDFETLAPKDRIALFEKLLQYSIPKLQAVTETQEQETKPINVNITLTNETASQAD